MAATVAITVRLFEPDDIAAVRALYAAAMQVPRGGGGGATTASPSPCHPSVAKFIRAQLRGPLASAATVADRFATDDDHRAGDDQQTEEEMRATRALNDEIAAQNALADKVDDAARLDYDAALARHQIEVHQGEEQARAAAEATRAAQDQYDKDYAAWREQVRLCQSGVRSACGTPVGLGRAF